MNVHIYPSYLTNESRILRIVGSLGRAGVFEKIWVMGIARADLPSEAKFGEHAHMVRVAPAWGRGVSGWLGKVLKSIGWYVAAYRILKKLPRLVCLNCHSLTVLPLCVFAKLMLGCKLVYDTHELETEVVSSRGLKRWGLKTSERVAIRWCDAVCVVNASIARWYEQAYGLSDVVVVHNMPAHQVQQMPISRSYLRDAIGLHDLNARIYLYQGLLTTGRGIALLLEVFQQMDDSTHLVFMGDGPMQAEIERAAAASSNIHHLPAVEPTRVLEFTVGADVGLSLIENVCLSYYYCLPNKIFEYAACGVPSLVSDFPEMRAFVEQMGGGWSVRPNVDDVLRRLRALDASTVEDVKQRMRDMGGGANWASQESTLLRMYESIGFVGAKEL